MIKVMNLDSLNSAEQQLLLQVERAIGLIEEKQEQFQQSGLFRESAKIYEAYVELIDSEGEGLEALKRALFLHWYHMAEPSCYSGLCELPEDVSRRVFESLERKIESETIDFELQWMVSYYNMIAEWVFTAHSDLPNLKGCLTRTDAQLWLKADLKAGDFMNRGQMGEYWRSVITTKEARSGFGAS